MKAFFNEIIHHPVPLDMNTLTALKRSSPWASTLYLWLVYRTFPLDALRCGSPGGRCTASSAWHTRTTPTTRKPFKTSGIKVLRELKKIKMAWPESELRDGSGPLDPLTLDACHRAAQSRSANKLICPFLVFQRPVSGLIARRVGLSVCT